MEMVFSFDILTGTETSDGANHLIPFYFSYYHFHLVIMNKNSRVDMLFTVLHE